MKNLSYIILLLFCVLQSCKKDSADITIVKGRVIEYFSKEPLAGIKLQVSYLPSILWPNTIRLCDTVTNENGQFYIEINNEPDAAAYFYRLIGDLESFDNIDKDCTYSIDKGEVNINENLVFQVATIEFKVKNVLHSLDTLFLSHWGLDVVNSQKESYKLYGRDSFMLESYTYGNSKTVIYWNIGDSENYDTLSIVADDTIEYLIEY